MSWALIEKGKLHCVLGYHLRSVPRPNVILKCFASDNEKKKEMVIKLKKKERQNLMKKPMTNSVQAFDAIVGKKGDKIRKEFTEAQQFKGDYKMKLKSLVLTVEEVGKPETDLKMDVVVKPKKIKIVRNDKESEKKKFFQIAKLVAEELKIDVTETQQDLYDRFSEIKAEENFWDRRECPWGRELWSDKDKNPTKTVRSIAQSDDLGIFYLSLQEKEEQMKLRDLQKEGKEKRVEGAEGAEGAEGIGRIGRIERTERIEGAEEHEKAEVGGKVDIVGTKVNLEVWRTLKEIERHELQFQLPSNYFDELKLLTEFGMLHRFPIDNEQDWHEEHKTDFTQHVFLEKHLDSWCPQTGPLRHFMELILVGLSKNPYISVKKKKEHIMWYKKYFIDKSSLLREVGLELQNSKTTESQS